MSTCPRAPLPLAGTNRTLSKRLVRGIPFRARSREGIDNILIDSLYLVRNRPYIDEKQFAYFYEKLNSLIKSIQALRKVI